MKSLSLVIVTCLLFTSCISDPSTAEVKQEMQLLKSQVEELKLEVELLKKPISTKQLEKKSKGKAKLTSKAIPLTTANESSSISVSATRSISSTKSYSSGRCQAITKKGSQCKRSASSGSSYCWQHG
jgi:SMC interacting uncharacterized protein involved in chromosome segregation